MNQRQARSHRALQRCGARLTPPCGLGIGRSRLPNRGSMFSARLSAVTPTSNSAWHSNGRSTTASCSASRLSRTYRQHAYCCITVPLHGPTTSCVPCAQPRRQPMLPRMTQPAASQRPWALRTHRYPPNQHELHGSHCGLADWVCAQPIPTVTQPTGLHGWTLCRSSKPECPQLRSACSQPCATTELRGCLRSWLQHRQRLT